jgi:hypothetical protein
MAHASAPKSKTVTDFSNGYVIVLLMLIRTVNYPTYLEEGVFFDSLTISGYETYIVTSNGKAIRSRRRNCRDTDTFFSELKMAVVKPEMGSGSKR